MHITTTIQLAFNINQLKTIHFQISYIFDKNLDKPAILIVVLQMLKFCQASD